MPGGEQKDCGFPFFVNAIPFLANDSRCLPIVLPPDSSVIHLLQPKEHMTKTLRTAWQRTYLLTGLLLLLMGIAHANEGGGAIRGTITTSEGYPAAGVTIQIKGKSKGAVSDPNGNFTLRNLPAGTYELVISLIGYETVEEMVTLEDNETKTISIQLRLTQKELEAVIVKSGGNGYTTNTLSSSLRLQTPLLEVPQNIQVVTTKALQDQQVISMSDGLIRNVSGALRLEHWGDLYTNIMARGSQIQAFRNGFNIVNSYWGPLTEDMSFTDHIEFVKGPAGFMLANGDPTGMYNVVTKKPTGQTRGEASLTMGSFGLFRTTLDLDGKLSKDGRLLYRLNLAGQEKKSHRAHEYNNRYAVAPVIAYQLDEKTTLTAEYIYQYAKMSDVGSYYVFSPFGYATLPVDFTQLPAGLPGTHIHDHSLFVNLQHQLSNQWKLTAQVAHLSYKQEGSSMWPNAVNPDGTMLRAVGIWDAKSRMSLGQAFLNGDVTTGQVHHRILAGIDVGNKEYFADWGQSHALDDPATPFDPLAPDYGIPSNGFPIFDYSKPLEQRALAAGGLMDQRYTGVYVQDELGFLDNTIRLTLAGRYTFVEQSEYGGPVKNAKHVTPRAGLSVSIDKQTAVYALYDQAFIPQTGQMADGSSVQPITGNNMEVGIKRDWGAWSTTLTAYRILKNNELTADPNSPPSAGLSIELGQKRSQGIEFDLRGAIVRGLNLVANYAYTDAKITKLAEGITGMKEGDLVPGFARHTANAWLTYKITEGFLRGAGISAGFTWLADRATYWEPSPEGGSELPDYFKVDAGLFWEKDRIRITANVYNVLNEYLYSGSWYSWLNAYNWQTDPPINLRISIHYKF